MKSGEIGRILFGAGGLIIGMLIGVAVTDRGDDSQKALHEDMAATRSAAEGVGDRVGQLEERLSGVEATLARLEEGAGSLSDKLDATGQGLVEKLDAQASAGQDALNAALQDMGRRIDAVAAAPAPQPGAESAEEAAASDPAVMEKDEADAGEAAGEDDADGLSVGHAQVFEDGKIRVFLSGLTEGSYDRKARLAVNGFEMKSLRAKDTLPVRVEDKDCTLTLDAIRDDKAQISVDCQ
ncbi:hypothetical protein FDP22_18685 (plasmid) [Paroceanicella profunda]|uniref:Uncharacterized protein n=1 Tax=Paroceanicella profunda TaxID=2579971 RepID=A0A5B8FJ71_9RHOB|nr:hypothetical protein [Paroceanicella profunda]QDL93908.1 hypothetical protein FDP22_18685 [Paroceanicella profunda]